MKKTYIRLSALFAAAVSLTSCNLDDPENINVYTFDVLNHINTGRTLEDGSDELILTPSNYTFRINSTTGTLKVESSDLIFDNTTHKIATSDLRYTTIGFTTGLQSGTVISFTSGPDEMSTGGSQPVSYFKGQLNSTVYPEGQLQSTPVISYKLNETMTVKTLRKTAWFTGATTVTAGDTKPVVSESGVYYLQLDNTNMQARLAIGNLRLTDEIDSSVTLNVSELPILLTSTGYKIVAPSAAITFPGVSTASRYLLKDLKIETEDESLTRLAISFTLTDTEDSFSTKAESKVRYILF